MYGVDGGDDAWEGDPVAWAAAAAADADWARESEGAGAVYDQDDIKTRFAHASRAMSTARKSSRC